MDKWINILGSDKVFATLDASSGYCQIELDIENMDMTELFAHNRLYHYSCMLFGLKKSPVTFYRAANIILALLKCHPAPVYLDEVATFSLIRDEHRQQVKFILLLMQKAGIKLKLVMCPFSTDTINYHGDMVTLERLHSRQRRRTPYASYTAWRQRLNYAISWNNAVSTADWPRTLPKSQHP